MLAQPRTVLAPLARRESTTIWGKMGFRIEHRYGGVIFLILGTGWILFGLTYGS